MLDEDEIAIAIDSIDRPGIDKNRLAGALRSVTVDTFRQRIRTSFEQTFGTCDEGIDTRMAKLRKIRGALLHPRGEEVDDGQDLIVGLNELREAIDIHLEHAREVEIRRQRG